MWGHPTLVTQECIASTRILVRRLLSTGPMRLASALSFILLAACGTEDTSTSTSLTRVPGECGDVEVHVIAEHGPLLDTGTGGTTDDGSTVILQRPGHHVLVLSAHEAVNWKVHAENGAIIDGIYAVGYMPQKVTANVKTKINTESKMEGGAGATGYKYPDTGTDALLKLTSIRVARHATSFHGCMGASKWVIGENMAVTSDCGTQTYTQYNTVLDCDGDNTCGSDGDGDGDTGDGSGDGSLY